MPWFKKSQFSLALLFIPLCWCVPTDSARAALPPKITALAPMDKGVSTPLRITSDGSGNHYVSDPRGGGILKYDSSWSLLQTITTSSKPLGIAISPQGNLIVGQGNHVSILNSSGSEIGMLGSGIGQFKLANGIALDDDGNIYVTDSLDNCVYGFNAAGAYQLRFGKQGADPGQFSSPSGIAYEKNTRQLAVADTLNGRIEFFDLSGAYQRTIGSFGSGPVKFSAPQGIAFEYDALSNLARMYVVDSYQSTVQMLNPTGSGAFLGYIGNYGTSSGKLVNPSDLLFERSTGKLIVVNSLSANLSQFKINDASTSGSVQFTVDNPPNMVSNPSLTLSGTVTSGATVSATVDTGAAAGTASYPSPTTWNLQVSPLQLGANHITITATNGIGEYTQQVVVVNLVNASPTVTIDQVSQLTNVSFKKISGTRHASDTISITTNTNAVAGPISYLTSTTWEATISSLASGDNVITALASNGSAVSAASITITLDDTSPTITLAGIQDSSNALGRVQNIFGTISDEHPDSVTINGIPATLIGNYFTGAVTLGGGMNEVLITSYDKAGNSTTATQKINFTTPGFPVTVISPSDMAYTKAGIVSVQGTAEPGYSVTVNGAPAVQTDSNWSAQVSLSTGLNTVIIAATDSLGITQAVKRTVINTSGPEGAVTTPAQDIATKDSALTLTGTAESGSTVSITADGKTGTAPLVNGAFTFNLSLSKEGVYPILVTVTNASGVSNSIVRNIVYDDTLPPMTVNLTKALTTKIVSGTTESGSTVTAEVNGSLVGTAVAVNGEYSFDLSTIDYSKDNLVIRSSDAAGNTRTRSLYPTGAIVSGGGEPDIRDAIKLMRIANGTDKPTQDQVNNGDIAPLKGGKPDPNGTIDANDVVLVLYRLIGLITW